MNNRTVVILLVLAAALLALTVALYSGERARVSDFAAGTPLIQGLAPERIHTIEIARGAERVTLTRVEGKDKDKGFALAERAGYPVALGKINGLILQCMDIRCKERITSSPDAHKELGVADDDPDAVAVRFLDAEKKPLMGFVKGKSVESGAGSYVRLLGQDDVFVSEDFIQVSAVATEYLDRSLIKVKREDIAEVAVARGEERYAVRRGETGALMFDPVPEGKKVKEAARDEVFGALTNLEFTDVSSAGAVSLDWDTTVTCRLSSGLEYTVALAEKGGTHYVRVSAKGPDVTGVEITRTEAEEELRKKEAILLAVETAKSFTPRHEPWVYHISSWNAGKLRKALAEMLEDLPKTEEKASAE